MKTKSDDIAGNTIATLQVTSRDGSVQSFPLFALSVMPISATTMTVANKLLIPCKDNTKSTMRLLYQGETFRLFLNKSLQYTATPHLHQTLEGL